MSSYSTQNSLLLDNLLEYYKDGKINKILKIINGEHDWPSPLTPWANQDLMQVLKFGILFQNIIWKV